jgi:hypothetical protein
MEGLLAAAFQLPSLKKVILRSSPLLDCHTWDPALRALVATLPKARHVETLKLIFGILDVRPSPV